MLNKWIPDKVWVRPIQDNGDMDCSISNLNMGMSRQCLWQNSLATLQGMTIFYSKKNVSEYQRTKLETKLLALLCTY
jgi:hypothetical protein